MIAAATSTTVVPAALPSNFVLAMPDDSLAPQIARGTELIFATGARSATGKGVLVEDSSGRRYVRRYGEGHAGAWQPRI